MNLIFFALLGLIAALFPEISLAQFGVNYGNLDPCPIDTIAGIGCYANDDPTPYIWNLITGARGIRTMFFTFLIAMLLFYGIKLLVGSRDENVLSEVKNAYGYAFFGTVLVGGAFLLADTFTAPDGLIINEASFNPLVINIIIFIKALIATVVGVGVFVHGFRLIVAFDEGENDKAKKGLLHIMVGAGIVMLADAIVDSFFGANIGIASSEILGFARFAVTVLGALSVLGLIVAGMMLVLSYEDAMKEKAKKLSITCAVAVSITIAAYGLVTIFIIPG